MLSTTYSGEPFFPLASASYIINPAVPLLSKQGSFLSRGTTPPNSKPNPSRLGFSHLGFPQAVRGFRRFCVCHRRRQACHKAPAYPVSLTLSRSGFSKNIRELRQPSTRRNPFTTSACYRSAALGSTHRPPAANSRTRCLHGGDHQPLGGCGSLP